MRRVIIYCDGCQAEKKGRDAWRNFQIMDLGRFTEADYCPDCDEGKQIKKLLNKVNEEFQPMNIGENVLQIGSGEE